MIDPLAVAVVGAAVAGSAAFVGLPLLAPRRRREPEHEPSLRLALLEERDRALGALKELEFDHRTGKISDADYLALLGSLRRDAAEALRALS